LVERHNNFDALRLIAAISVIFSHAFLIGEERQDAEPLMRLTGGQTILGVVGVFVFFTISGYLVTQSFEQTRSAPRFAAKRALRIYPGLLVCVLLSAFVLGPWATSLPLGAYFRDGGTFAYVLTNFTMINPTHTLPGVWFTR
jgi:peptidoglycan/LPS O-acetylase OafA/YrhL